jgi:hypothetical protein
LQPLVAAFGVGVALALAGELAVGLLLYAADGFVRALTVILAAGLGGLGLGLATAPTPGPRLSDALRRRWLLAVATFAAAALMALAWSLQEDASAGWRRGAALAVLAVLPLYACGVVLGALSSAHPRVRVGAAAVLGAAVGVTLQGAVLLARVEPVSVYLLGVVILSAAALMESGSASDAVEDDEASPPPPETGAWPDAPEGGA